MAPTSRYTHTALLACVGATPLGGLSIATALNVTTLASIAMNAFCTYCYGDKGAPILAGIVFVTSAHIAAHLNKGHFNLTPV